MWFRFGKLVVGARVAPIQVPKILDKLVDGLDGVRSAFVEVQAVLFDDFGTGDVRLHFFRP